MYPFSAGLSDLIVREHSSILKGSRSYKPMKHFGKVFKEIQGVLYALDATDIDTNKHIYLYSGVDIKETIRGLLSDVETKVKYRNKYLMCLKVGNPSLWDPYVLYIHFEKHASIFDIVKSWEGLTLRIGFDSKYVYHTRYLEWCMANSIFLSFGVTLNNPIAMVYHVHFVKEKCWLPSLSDDDCSWKTEMFDCAKGKTMRPSVIRTKGPLDDTFSLSGVKQYYNLTEIRRLQRVPPMPFEYVKAFDPLDRFSVRELRLAKYTPFWSPKSHLKCYPELNYYAWILKNMGMFHDLVCVVLDLMVKLELYQGIKKCVKSGNIWELTSYPSL